jgi:hypothetical protein
LRVKRWKKEIFIKDMSEISLYIDSHLVGNAFSADVCEWFLVFD